MKVEWVRDEALLRASPTLYDNVPANPVPVVRVEELRLLVTRMIPDPDVLQAQADGGHIWSSGYEAFRQQLLASLPEGA